MSDLLADPILAYRRFVEWRVVGFAVDIGTRIPSEVEVDRLEAALLREQDAIVYRAAGGDPEIVCLLSILQAEEDRSGPMGGVLSEENDHDRRLYEIFLRRLVQRHRATVQKWIDNATVKRTNLPSLLLYASQCASSSGQRFVDQIMADFRWWQNIEDSGAAPPRWTRWDVPTQTLIGGERRFAAERMVGDTAMTLVVTVGAEPNNKMQVGARLTGSQDVQVRMQFILEQDGCTLRGHVRGIKVGFSTCTLIGERVAEIRVWSRESQS